MAAFAGLEIAAPAAYEHYVDNKKPDFLSKFPHGKIPAFEGAGGFKVVEGAAIARYSESSHTHIIDRKVGEEETELRLNIGFTLNSNHCYFI